MAQATSGLVDYGATSEEDNFSDVELRKGPELLLPASSSLLMSHWSSNGSLSPDCPTSGLEQIDSQLDQSAQAPDDPLLEVLTVNFVNQKGGRRRRGSNATFRLPARRTVGAGHTDVADGSDSENSNSQSPRLPLLVHSSSEDDKPPTKRPRLQISSREAQGCGAYTLKFHQLTSELRDLLAGSRAFFTKPHSLQRPAGQVTMSTFSKAEERILCKTLRCLS